MKVAERCSGARALSCCATGSPGGSTTCGRSHERDVGQLMSLRLTVVEEDAGADGCGAGAAGLAGASRSVTALALRVGG